MPFSGLVVVGRCAGFDGTWRTALWLLYESESAASTSLKERQLSEVTYGIAPKGYGSSHDSVVYPRGTIAPPLSAGCYAVSISGTGELRFAVDNLGFVRELRDAR